MTMTEPFTGVVVANRGEIARRVIRTARRLGLPTVAVFTAADKDALHVREADEAVEVSSYLSVDEIAEVAHYRGGTRTAVHPGYGFLSENSEFARELEGTEGVTLVGPRADVMDAMGRKDKARDIAVAAGVPVVGTPPAAIDLAESRGAFGRVLDDAGLPAPPYGMATSFDGAR